MKFKKSARIFGINPVMVFAALVAGNVYKEFNNIENFAITSATDGKHSEGSDHYVGNALDLRTWGFEDMGVSVQSVAKEIESRLTPEFEVFAEPTHIHIGFDPQQGLNVK